MQFIIKNCPACRDYDVFGRDNEGCCYLEMKYCKDVGDCIMKQIAEKCKNECDPTDGEWTRNRENFAKEILSILEIQECE